MGSSDEEDNVPGCSERDTSVFLKKSDEVNDKNFKDTFGIVRCTICSEQVNPYFGKELLSHPTLHVVVCKACHKFWKKPSWTVDDEGKDEQCQWCGQGGDIICCDFCTHSFCKFCVKKNAGRSYLTDLEAGIRRGNDFQWKCFVCEPSPIENIQRKYVDIVKFVNNVRITNKRKSSLVKKHFPFATPSNFEKQENLVQICAKVIKFTKTAVDAFESIRETIAVDAENFRETRKEAKKAVKSLRETIDGLTAGLLWVNEHLDRFEFGENSKGKNVSKAKTPKNAAAVKEQSDNNSTAGEKEKKKAKETFKLIPLIPKDLDETLPMKANLDETLPMKANRISSKIHLVEKKFEPKTSTPLRKTIENEDVEREKLLKALDLNSDNDEETTADDDDDIKMLDLDSNGPNVEETDDEPSEKKEFIGKKSTKSKKNSSETIDSDPKKRLETHKVEQKSNVIPESDLSSSLDVSDVETDKSDDSAPKRNLNIIKSTPENDKKSDEKRLKKIQKNENNDENEEGFDSELEKKLKSMKNFRLEKLLNRNPKPTDSPKKIYSTKTKSTKKDTKEFSDESDLDQMDSDTNEEKQDEKPVTPKNLMNGEKNERDNCLNALGISSDESAVISDDDVDEESEKIEAKKDKPKKNLFDDENLDVISVCGETNGDGDEEEKYDDDSEEFVKKTRSTSKTIEKLLKTKINKNKLNDFDTEPKRNKIDVKPKTKPTKKKKIAKILSSDEEEEKEKSESNDEVSEDQGSMSDDDDFEEKPSTSRGRRQTRRTAVQEKKSKGAKKRGNQRKRVAVSTDENSDDDDDKLTSNKSGGRKKIHNLMGKGDLATETINAYEAEKERRKRIAEKQKLFNEIVAEEDPKAKCPKFKKMILEKNPQTDEILVEVNPKLVERLKPHQVQGVQFLFENTIESIEKAKQAGQGCVLAHCMGLGKTLQVIGYLHTILMNKNLNFKTALVIAPLNVVLNWQHEFDLWLGDDLSINVFEMSAVKQNPDRVKLVDTWQEDGGVLIISYTMYLKLAVGREIKKEKWRKSFAKALVDPGPDIVICDEGHLLKNEKTGISKIINTIRTRRRICLTGTPLQNNLNEYYTMVQFVKPNLLGSKVEFANRFSNPIRNGQYVDSTPQDVSLMKRRSHILHKTLEGCVNRQDYTALAQALPPKYEYVLTVMMSDRQKELYQFYLDNVVGGAEDLAHLKARRSLFADFQVFQRIWTHPYGLILHQREVERRDLLKDEKDEDESFIDDDDDETSDDEPKRKKRKKDEENDENNVSAAENGGADDDSEIEIIKTYSTRRNVAAGDATVSSRPTTPIEAQGWFKGLVTENDRFDVEIGGKFVLFFEILRKCEAIGDKILVFSQSLIALNLIEIFLEHYERNGWSAHPDSLASLYKWGWKQESDYFRLDGSTSAEKRKKYAAIFNESSNLRARLFLISTRAGSLGMNLFGANRVIVFDASWNPTHDIQSMFRVYRFGQTKPVYIYRFISQGTMEETIYERGVTKQSLSCRVVDEQQIDRHFSDRDLQALYEFTPNKSRGDKQIRKLDVPKDRLLADLMFEKAKWIFASHEHDSLIQNLEGEQLSEAEREAAWNEYENERKNPRVQNRMMPIAKDRFELFCQAMPVLKILIKEGNNIINASGEHLDTNLEQVVRNWIDFDRAVQANPAELITKLHSLIANLREVTLKASLAAAAVNAQQRPAANNVAQFPQFVANPNSSIFPSFAKK